MNGGQVSKTNTDLVLKSIFSQLFKFSILGANLTFILKSELLIPIGVIQLGRNSRSVFISEGHQYLVIHKSPDSFIKLKIVFTDGLFK